MGEVLGGAACLPVAGCSEDGHPRARQTHVEPPKSRLRLLGRRRELRLRGRRGQAEVTGRRAEWRRGKHVLGIGEGYRLSASPVE
jgi:hypothetical protein